MGLPISFIWRLAVLLASSLIAGNLQTQLSIITIRLRIPNFAFCFDALLVDFRQWESTRVSVWHPKRAKQWWNLHFLILLGLETVDFVNFENRVHTQLSKQNMHILLPYRTFSKHIFRGLQSILISQTNSIHKSIKIIWKSWKNQLAIVSSIGTQHLLWKKTLSRFPASPRQVYVYKHVLLGLSGWWKLMRKILATSRRNEIQLMNSIVSSVGSRATQMLVAIIEVI